MINTTQFTPKESWRQLSSLLGYAVQLHLASPRRNAPATWIDAHMWPAVKLGQIEFLFDSLGVPAAYVTWAYLSDETLQRMTQGTQKRLHISEWNDGTNLWIYDIVAPFGDARILLQKLRQRLKTFTRAYAIRPATNARPQRHVSVGWKTSPGKSAKRSAARDELVPA